MFPGPARAFSPPAHNGVWVARQFRDERIRALGRKSDRRALIAGLEYQTKQDRLKAHLLPYAVRDRSVNANSAAPQCVKCGTAMEFAGRLPVEACGYRYERWKFECPNCRNLQTYTMGRATEGRPIRASKH